MKSQVDKVSLAKNFYISWKHKNFSREEILAIQEKRFRKLLKYVLKNSEFYREYYGEHGINLENYKTVNIKELPTINKSILMKNYDKLVCKSDLKKAELEKFIGNISNRGKLYKDKYHVIHSSGSTGEAGYTYIPKETGL